jgi:1-acyl-sn-glycerol-3-phosphate acyltransferase
MLNGFWWRFWYFLRRRIQLKVQRLVEIELRGLENLQKAVGDEQGVLISSNHSGHADPLILYKAAERTGRGFYFMAAWQVFARENVLARLILRQHGVFSVDREGTDMRAFRQAVDILQNSRNPLVIFPEGEVYHVNDKVMPFREGAAAIAMTATKKAKRPVVCVPCGIKYQYVDDPMSELVELMGRLEEQILWRRRDDMPLTERIYRFAEGALALKELEYLGHTQSGGLPERIESLSEKILSGQEEFYGIRGAGANLPERVKAVRREAIKQLSDDREDLQERARFALGDLFVVTQLFSYPGDYVAHKPTTGRIAETLDKFEEDVFKVPTATVRGSRRAVLSFGKPIEVERCEDKKSAIHTLTESLEEHVQGLLDGIGEGD